ncbi:hypothetical protein C9890_0494, partial [Perkinsus sp. BL_2016]
MKFTESPVPARVIDILYEDERILALHKPAGWPVHPCGGYGENSITQELKRLRPDITALPLHRLDRLTSGVLLFTKRADIAAELSAMLATGDEKKVKKIYIARVLGNFKKAVTIQTFIKCVDPRVGVYATCDQSTARDSQAKWSVTDFQPIIHMADETIVQCQPLTGRTHQIRVHLQHAGYPIVNDPCYGSGLVTATEICLHAWQYSI